MDAHPYDIARDLAHAIVASEREQPVRPIVAPEECPSRFELALPVEGLGMARTVEKLKALVLATPSTASNRFFNQLFGGRDDVAVMAEMVVAVLNTSMYTYKVAGPQVLVEEALVRHMGVKMGYPEAGGIFSPGGSLSNLVALLLARERVASGVRQSGVTPRSLRVYTSATSHYSVGKAAGIVGVGRDNVVKIPTDREGRMRPELLDEAILRDLAEGHQPMLVNATLGTTVEGAFDPVDAIADVTERHGIWLHLDGAYGATMVLSPRYQHLFEGSHRSDSITWDAHKMMGVPLTSSVLLTRDRRVLAESLAEQADYLFQGDADRLNPGLRSLQCGRRNDFLKLWAAWQYHGDDGYADRIERSMALVAHALSRIAASPELSLTLSPESMNVCFTVDGVASPSLCDALRDQARALVGHATVAGESVVRVVFVNPDLTVADVDYFFDTILSVAAELRG